MNLIYRAQNFKYTPAPTKFATPRAINWRHQLPGWLYIQTPSVHRLTRSPCAVNWRYQLP
ncbi:hypothetical protein [Stenomitos frigidus]|uniref:hypothetical protein n=1 Tax=Stenomitos frigidus TaxID=1886765 RepID=UPI0011B22419|nr:hypothetical protein [Stenomitos frigidus]